MKKILGAMTSDSGIGITAEQKIQAVINHLVKLRAICIDGPITWTMWLCDERAKTLYGSQRCREDRLIIAVLNMAKSKGVGRSLDREDSATV